MRDFPPCYLPRLELKEGVPETLSTFVVVPTLFIGEAGIREQIEQMEIRYLSNPDGQVRFALLSDWADAHSGNVAERWPAAEHCHYRGSGTQ